MIWREKKKKSNRQKIPACLTIGHAIIELQRSSRYLHCMLVGKHVCSSTLVPICSIFHMYILGNIVCCKLCSTVVLVLCMLHYSTVEHNGNVVLGSTVEHIGSIFCSGI